jgi:hypothetical protein
MLLRIALVAALAVGFTSAGEKKLMHCFAFTALDTATEADWQAFYKATDELPGKVPGLTRVWHGKLRRPLGLVSPANMESYRKLGAAKAGEEVVLPVRRDLRQYGVCMEMADETALTTYSNHAAHKAWEAVYEKVRRPGTTTLDILGQ